MLLVRILQNDTEHHWDTPIGRLEQYMDNIRWPKSAGKRLVITSQSVAPNFKIMMYPHRQGDPIPETKWSNTGKVLTVKIGDQQDSINFFAGDKGELKIER